MADPRSGSFARSFSMFQKSLDARHRARGMSMKKSADDSADLFIYDVIGENFWTGGGVTGKSVAAELKKAEGVKTLNVYINSPGGSVFDGEAIYNQLQRFDATKNVVVDGLAASAASFIAMAGDKITMAEPAQMMIHRAMGGAYGFESDLRAVADVLALLTDTIAGIYAKRTGCPMDECLKMMEAETWMDAAKAVELGFADEVVAEQEPDEDDKPAASASPVLAAIAQTQARITSLPAMRRESQMRKHRIAASLDPSRASPGQTATK